jgi:signal transduction histidine kinase
MKVEDILNKGKSIIDSNIKEYKAYYHAHKEIIENSNDLDSSVEFELQYLKYLIHVENSYMDAINQAKHLIKLSNITLYSISKVYRLLGVAYNHTGEYVQAMEAYMSSVKILNQIANKNKEQLYELGLNYHNISILYKNEEDPEHYEAIKRLEYIKLAEAIFIDIDSKKGLGIIYNSLSNYYYSLNNFPYALGYQFRSLKIKEIEKDELGIAVNYGNISSIYLKCNKLDKAEQYLLLSKEIKLKNSNSYSICKLYLQLGNLYDKKFEFDKCETSFLHALEIADSHNLTFEIGEALSGLTELFEKTKDFEQAYYYLKRNKILKEAMHDINKSKALVELKYKHEAEKKEDESKLLIQKNAEIERYATQLKNTNFELRQFAQIASHDLKEPARLIKMYVGILEKKAMKIEESDSYIMDYIKQASENLYNKVNELYTYTNINEQQKIIENVIVEDEFIDIKHHLRNSTKTSNFNISYSNLPKNIKINRSKFNQLFFQLIENGIVYNNNFEKNVHIEYQENNAYHIFTISDNGIGIDNIYFDKIFDMFERLHPDHKFQGTGIGLAIVKKIITEINGYIEVSSKLGEGSQFKVYIQK